MTGRNLALAAGIGAVALFIASGLTADPLHAPSARSQITKKLLAGMTPKAYQPRNLMPPRPAAPTLEPPMQIMPKAYFPNMREIPDAHIVAGIRIGGIGQSSSYIDTTGRVIGHFDSVANSVVWNGNSPRSEGMNPLASEAQRERFLLKNGPAQKMQKRTAPPTH